MDDDEKSDVDFDVSVTEDKDDDENECYPIEKRKEIIDYWQNNGSPRKFSAIQNRYKKVKNAQLLYTWKSRIYGGEG